MEEESRADGSIEQKPRPVFQELMTIFDSSWEDVKTDDMESSVRYCCGPDSTDCQVSVWDLESLQIWNDMNNVLDFATLQLDGPSNIIHE